jgi:anti-anti-sigma regulatory factor
MLMLTAKSIASRAGKLALINPTPDVRGVLDITGITGIIPIHESLESAEAELLA